MAGKLTRLARAAGAARSVDRVRLRAVPADEVLAFLAGERPNGPRVVLHADYPTADTLDAMAMLIAAHQAMGPAPLNADRWWIHQIIVDDVVIGDVAFHGPPGEQSPRTVEIGYAVVPQWRGQGVATRACALILEIAWTDGAESVTAETEPGNVASERVLLRNGFDRQPDGTFALTQDRRPGRSGGAEDPAVNEIQR